MPNAFKYTHAPPERQPPRFVNGLQRPTGRVWCREIPSAMKYVDSQDVVFDNTCRDNACESPHHLFLFTKPSSDRTNLAMLNVPHLGLLSEERYFQGMRLVIPMQSQYISSRCIFSGDTYSALTSLPFSSLSLCLSSFSCSKLS